MILLLKAQTFTHSLARQFCKLATLKFGKGEHKERREEKLVSVCVCAWERERVCVCQRVREKKSVKVVSVCVNKAKEIEREWKQIGPWH